MIKYMLSLVLVAVVAMTAQATNGYSYYYYPQQVQVIKVERIVTPNVTVRKEFVEVPGLEYISNYHNGVAVQQVVVQRQVNKNRQVIVQRVVVDNHHQQQFVQKVVVRDNHGRQFVVQQVVDQHGNVLKVQKVQQVQKQQQRRGFFRR